MENNQLTEREKLYLDYWRTNKEERPTKTLLIVTWVLVVAVFFIFAILCLSTQGLEIAEYLGVFGTLICLAVILAYFTIKLSKRMQQGYSQYEVIRTQIISKEICYPANTCLGITFNSEFEKYLSK